MERESRLRRHRRTLERVRMRRRPTARVVSAPETPLDAVAVVSGAFDPPTLAHRALALTALGEGSSAAFFALGTVTLDKGEAGLALEDRLDLLIDLAASDPRLGVLVHNAGLYAEQAAAVGRILPAGADLALVVGLDKLPQILDPRYYDDLDAGLARLFARARLLVAPRSGDGRRAFRALRDGPRAATWRSRLGWLPLARRWHDVSATDVRRALAEGRDPGPVLPRAFAEHLVALGVYDPRRRAAYRRRVRRIREE